MMLLRRGVQQLAAAAGAEQGVLAFAQQLSDRLSSSLTAGSSNPSRIQQIHLYSTQQTPAQGANPPYVPWTPTKDLAKRKVYRKRMRFLMQVRCISDRFMPYGCSFAAISSGQSRATAA